MKTIYSYLRVSSEIQSEKGMSLENQRNQARNIGRRKDIKVFIMSEEAKSSQEHLNARPVFQKIVKQIQAGKIKHLWVERMDRLFRNYHQQMQFIYTFVDEHKGKLYTGANCDEVRFDTAQDQMMFKFLALQSESENEMRSERSRLGKQYLLENVAPTKAVYLGGSPTYGYKNANKLWKVDKTESAIVKKIFTEYVKGKTLNNIAKDLDTSGVSPRRAKFWNLETLRKMLANESYTGLKKWSTWKRNPLNKKEKTLVKTDYYKIPKIINRSLFLKAQKITLGKQSNFTKDNNKKHFAILDGLLKCECGEMFGNMVKNYTRKNLTTQTKLYYCVSRERGWKSRGEITCTNTKSLNMDKADELIINAVREVYKNSNVLKDQFKQVALSIKKKSSKQIQEDTKAIDDKITNIQYEINTLSESIADTEYKRIKKVITSKVADMVIKKLNKEVEQCNKEITDLSNELNTIDTHNEWIDWVRQYGNKLEKGLSSLGGDKPKSEFLKGLVDKITISKIEGTSRYKKLTQVGHHIEITFKLKIVDDGMVYNNPKKKSSGYVINEGKKKIRIKTFSVNPISPKTLVKQGKKKA